MEEHNVSNIDAENETLDTFRSTDVLEEADQGSDKTVSELPCDADFRIELGNEVVSSFVHMLFEVRDYLRLPESSANKIMDLYYASFKRFSDKYFHLVSRTLETYNINNKKEILSSLDISKSFDDISSLTDNKLMDILHTHYEFISPLEICFPDTTDKMYYVSIRETIQSMSKNLKMFSRNDVFMRSKHINEYFGSITKEAIYIKLYTDEFEVCNPLGASRKKHQIVAVYFSFLNISDEICSKLGSHFLVCLAYERLYEKNKSSFFTPLIEELKSLFFDEVTVDNRKLPVLAVGICGDNKSVHDLVGLGKIFSAGYICRFCKVQFSDLEFNIGSRDSRTHTTYVEDYKYLTHGIRARCSFEELIYFDFEYFFPPDIMHDLLEGVSHMVIVLVFNEALKQMTLNDMNEILQKFNFGVSVPCISRFHLKKMKIPLKAADTLRFLSLLPLAFGNLFDATDSVWRLLIMHCDLLSFCFQDSDKYSKDFLEVLVTEHNALIYELCPDNKPKYRCKLHYITHYPALLKHYGCLKLYWCMRFEGMHQFFKRMIAKTHQFRNVPYSCALRYQMYVAVSSSISNGGSTFSPCDATLTHVGSALDYDEISAINDHFSIAISLDEDITISSTLICNDLNYSLTTKEPTCYASTDPVNIDLIFHSVEKIVRVRGEWLAITSSLKVVYHPHFRVYSIEEKCIKRKAVPVLTIKFAPLPIRVVRCVRCICLPLTYPL